MKQGPYAAQVVTASRGGDPNEEIRIVLLGKTGNGKSSSGNTILNRKTFKSELSPSSVTAECEKARGTVDGRRIAVIDTPGIYDTKYSKSEVYRKLKECISLSAPGPHVFLIVINLGRFTKEEQKTVELLQLVFGERAARYTMVLFSHGDELEGTRIEDFFSKSDELSHLIAKCNSRYHVLNNKVSNTTQVSQLLAKIRRMVCNNGGTFYTNEMFQEAEKAIQERTAKILRDQAEEKRREESKLRAKFGGEKLQTALKRLREGFKMKAREAAEKKNRFLETGLIATSVDAGVAIGLAAGTAGGPLCIGMGAVVGGVAGVIVGVLLPLAAKALKNKCTIQ